MRIAMAQINAIVGDLEGNTRKICEAIEPAAEKGADLIAFPELALTGYPPEDLLLKPDFVAANREALLEVARRTPAGSARSLPWTMRPSRSPSARTSGRRAVLPSPQPAPGRCC